MEPTLEVRIRREDERRAVPLCKIVPGTEEALIANLKLWGVYDGDETVMKGIVGQYVLGESVGYFEVMVGGDDDDA